MEELLGLPQLPPRRTRRSMVLVVVTEKVAGKKCQHMIFTQRTRMMLVIMLTLVGLVGAKVK